MKFDKILAGFSKLENNSWVSGIREGLVLAVPLVLIGSFSLILQTFLSAIDYSSTWLEIIYNILTFMYDATFGILSVFMASFVCFCCIQKKEVHGFLYGAPAVAIAGLILLNGGLTASITSGGFGVRGMFTAIVSALLTSEIYSRLSRFSRKRNVFSYGGDYLFQNILNNVVPVAGTLIFFVVFNQFICLVFDAGSFQELFINLTNGLFTNLGRGTLSGVLFVLFSSVLWFFGVHGNDVLEHVSQTLFAPAIEENLALIANGQAPTEIFSKSFFDIFVLMGGSGTLMALLFSLLIFSKNSGNRNLVKASAIPMLFNVNELMLFGLPIILNPIFLIPFLVTPLVCVLTATTVVSLGWVPIPIHAVEWTTPILISGYLATGSVAGSILQIFNLGLGILIYAPFIKIYERFQENNASNQIKALTAFFQEAESEGNNVVLTHLNNDLGLAARHLAFELKHYLDTKTLKLYYQPQFDATDVCIGAEALLRWKHPRYGMIYPPLVIELAKEMDFLTELEIYVFTYVSRDADSLRRILGPDAKLSLNVTPETLRNQKFLDFLGVLSKTTDFIPYTLCIEITEQTTLGTDEMMNAILVGVHELGFLLAIDDFSMGSTSLKYLQNNHFNLIKLDGSLVRNLQRDPYAKDIIASIVSLSKALHIQVLAEYTENRILQKALEEIGCTYYQGYLYSPAVPLEDLAQTISKFSKPQ